MKRAWSLILTLAMLASMIAALPLTAQAEASEAWFVDHIVDPTCTEQGYTVEYNMFTYETRNVNYKPALGHIWGNWNLLSEPDCTHTGQRVRYCRRCQTRDVETLPALGHSWNGGAVTTAATWYPPAISLSSGATAKSGVPINRILIRPLPPAPVGG